MANELAAQIKAIFDQELPEFDERLQLGTLYDSVVAEHGASKAPHLWGEAMAIAVT